MDREDITCSGYGLANYNRIQAAITPVERAFTVYFYLIVSVTLYVCFLAISLLARIYVPPRARLCARPHKDGTDKSMVYLYTETDRNPYFLFAIPQLRVTRPQNVSSPSLYSQVKLDFIGIVIHSTLPRKVLPAEAITTASSSQPQSQTKFEFISTIRLDTVNRQQPRTRPS